MSLLRNDAVNRVSLHYVIQSFASSAGGIFMLVFLVKSGVPVPLALVYEAGLVGFRFLLRPLALPLAIRFGVKPMLMAGTLASATTFPLLALIGGPGWPLIVLCAWSSVGYLLYWLCFHAYFAAIGDDENRGGHIGVREAAVAVTGVIAPLLGAWALTSLGALPAFALVGVIQAAAVFPLLGAPNVPVAAKAPEGFRVAPLGLRLMAGDGLFSAGYHFVWQIALFLALRESYVAYGGAAAAAALAGAAGGFFLGRYVDMGHGRRATWAAYATAAVVVILRASSLDTPWLAVIANAAGSLILAILTPVMMTPVYRMSKASSCTFRFHMATEGAWDIGGFVGCLTAAGLVVLDVPLAWTILMALIPAAALVVMLSRFYGPRSP